MKCIIKTIGVAILLLLSSSVSWGQSFGEKITFTNDWWNTRVNVTGYLSLPVSFNANFPVMVILPSSGDLHARDWANARMLNTMGVATLVVDSHGSRGIKSLYKDKQKFTLQQEAADGESAIRYLASRPDIDKTRIGIMGRSLGGESSLQLALKGWRQRHSVPSPAPKLILAIYPGCVHQWENATLHPDTNLVFFLAELDDLTPAAQCVSYGERMKSLGGKVSWTIYPGAHHSFDILRTVMFEADQENYAGCSNLTSEHALIRADNRQPIPRDQIASFLNSCKKMGGTIGGDPEAAKLMDKAIEREVTQHLLSN